ncbi:ATP-binding cassette domain-containing protein [Parabacteroides sp. AM08-6]|uniref:ATP-binding cassette domain-containing protein n=1 Tax=Parabacteroides sp. AM08-6 TaxID=2292053 RepID=UPI000EFE9729|nr:ATP-binding cassette domain-containing protein [Parabacteroides sp. AM08-6]RHJ87925.1 ATP-binding cassette domain-containing protein [Parabacteroides sp. AM08-6]
MKKSLLPLLSIGILLLCWEIFAIWVNLPDLIPSVPRLIQTLAELFTSVTFYQSVSATLIRGVAGMFLSLIAATGIACLFSRNELVYELFRPLLAIMRSVPVISFILLALIFLHPESIPLMIAFLTMFPLLTENITKGIRSQRKEFMIMANRFQIGWWNKLTQVIYPQINPFLFSGLTSASGFGWRAIIMGEVLAQCSFGIGGEMKRAQSFIAVPELLAWTIVAILVSFFFDKGISWLGKHNFPIHYNKTKIFPLPETVTIRMENISFQYEDAKIISGFTYTFKTNRIYGITGASGTGKTTLLNLINGIIKPQAGNIHFLTSKSIATVFQEPVLLSQLTVKENIALPLASFTDKQTALGKAASLLEEMELNTLSGRYPDELSFGQQQRVAIARALIFPAAILLMDEPFKGLDEALSYRIIERIRKRLEQTGQILIFTSHNPEELHRLADEIIYINTPAMNK